MREVLDNDQGIDILHSLAHSIDDNVPTMASCAQNFGYTQRK
jgi:hypothetical protein